MGKISLQMYTMREHTQTLSDLEKTIEKLAEIGFKMLQYSIPETYDAKAVYDIFEKNGITNDSVFTPFLKIEENTKKILEQCELFQTDYVRVDSMPKDLSDSPAGYKMYAHCLNEASAELKKHGKKLLYHFHAFEWTNFAPGCRGIDILLNETTKEYVGFQPDVFWLTSAGTEASQSLKLFAGRAKYMHVKDYAIKPRTGALEDVPNCFASVGRGNLNWPGILKTAREIGIENFVVEDDMGILDPFESARQSIQNMKQLGF